MMIGRNRSIAALGVTLGLWLVGSVDAAETARSTVVLHVDATALSGGNGSAAAPYTRIPDAVTEARLRFLANAARVKIQIEPGLHQLSETLLLDVPGLELQGSNVTPIDSDGWPAGVVDSGSETRITFDGTFDGGPLIHVVPSGPELNASSVTIANLTVDYNRGGNAILIERSQGFTVKACFITRASPGGILALASSGTIVGNYITGVGCGACIGGGNASSPANVRIVGNRSMRNVNGGVLLDAGLTGSDDSRDTLSVVVQHNDLSDNTTAPLNSFGIRIFTSSLGPFRLANDNHATALIVRNRIHGNRIGVVIDAGFPYRVVDSNVDPRLFRGSLDVNFRDNDVAANLSAPALITFTRNSAALSPTQLSSWKYLQDSSFLISDPQNSLADYWLDHPAFDPIDGRTLRNVLTVNGHQIGNDRTIP
jgi:hypothetical protein